MQTVRIRINQAKEGMIAAGDIFSEAERLVVAKDTILTNEIINRLKSYRIFGLYVYKVSEDQRKVEKGSYIDLLRNTESFMEFEKSYEKTLDSVKINFEELVKGEAEIDADELLISIELIVGKSRNGIHALEMLHGIRDYDDATFTHSVNVSIICSIFAEWLKLSKEDTNILRLSGLFHDIGKMNIPNEILLKKDKYTEEEYRIMQTHVTEGYEILKDLPIDYRMKLSALQHHERCDGSGYPNGIKGGKINSFAKIIAIADVYDAMTSDRHYRAAICPFDVVTDFERDGLNLYDPQYLMIFLERIVNAYMNNTVELSDGRLGEVILINKHALGKPVVKVDDEFIDLSKDKSVRIVTVV